MNSMSPTGGLTLNTASVGGNGSALTRSGGGGALGAGGGLFVGTGTTVAVRGTLLTTVLPKEELVQHPPVMLHQLLLGHR